MGREGQTVQDCECLLLEGMEKWRVGAFTGRTLYRQHGIESCRKDPFLGIMETPELAAVVVGVMNQWFSAGNASTSPAVIDSPSL